MMDELPVGIGPVLTGTDDAGRPAYLYGLLYPCGRVEQRAWPKKPGKVDRSAKMEATLHRLRETETLRRSGGVTVTWDATSFETLVRLVRPDRGFRAA